MNSLPLGRINYLFKVIKKQDYIDCNIFNLFIFQDFNVSNAVAKNYQNKKLQVFLSKLLEDKKLIAKAELQHKFFSEDLLDLNNGISWEGSKDSQGLKDIKKIQPPILDTLK